MKGDFGLDRGWTEAVFGGFLGEIGAFSCDLDAKVVSVGGDLGVFGAKTVCGEAIFDGFWAINGCDCGDFGDLSFGFGLKKKFKPRMHECPEMPFWHKRRASVAEQRNQLRAGFCLLWDAAFRGLLPTATVKRRDAT